MKVKVTESELQELIRNEVRKIVGEDALMSPPDVGEPHYLSLDGPAVPVDMGDDYEDSMYMDEPCPGCGMSPCIGMQDSLNEGGCGCGSKKMSDIKPLGGDPVDKMVSDILVSPRPCPGCGKIHTGPCGDDHHRESSYMAKPQLAKIAKYASMLLSMIDEGEEIQDWQESKIAQMSQMIGDVYHSIEYKKHSGKA